MSHGLVDSYYYLHLFTSRSFCCTVHMMSGKNGGNQLVFRTLLHARTAAVPSSLPRGREERVLWPSAIQHFMVTILRHNLICNTCFTLSTLKQDYFSGASLRPPLEDGLMEDVGTERGGVWFIVPA